MISNMIVICHFCLQNKLTVAGLDMLVKDTIQIGKRSQYVYTSLPYETCESRVDELVKMCLLPAQKNAYIRLCKLVQTRTVML